MADDIEIESDDEGWSRVVDEEDEDILGVGVSRIAGETWHWEIGINAAEFVREEPFESTFRDAIDAAIRRVSGITDVIEEDREVWLASGPGADGEQILRSVARALDNMADDIEAALNPDED